MMRPGLSGWARFVRLMPAASTIRSQAFIRPYYLLHFSTWLDLVIRAPKTVLKGGGR